ncbi:VOC family protein [Rhodobacterales bacterium HKCCE2091]|nr:VOC family protein [Rhodobacterales bacterium HKCCE2091]
MAPGRARVSPFIVVANADAVADFARGVFGARDVRPPVRRSDGSLWNLELAIGDCTLMLGDGQPGMIRPGFLYVHVEDVDATYARAVEAGARPVQPPEDRFYGDRDGGVEDAGGNLWWIASHVRDLTDDEIAANARSEEAARAAERGQTE